MSLEKILKTINEKEKNERNVILAEYDEIFSEIKKNTEAEIEEHRALKENILNKKIEFLKQKTQTDLNIFKSKEILKIKREILNEVYAEFKEKIKRISQKNYEDWLIKEIAKLNIEKTGILTIGIGIIEISSNLGIDCQIEFDKDLDFGFVYKSGKIIVDNTLESILNHIKAEKELEVSKIVF